MIAGLQAALTKIADRQAERMDIVVDRLTREDAEALLEFSIEEQGELAAIQPGPGARELHQVREADRERIEDLAIAAILVTSGRWPSLWLKDRQP
jgi:hypothetical protein